MRVGRGVWLLLWRRVEGRVFEEEKEGSVLHRGVIREIGDAVRGRAVVVVVVETDVRRARRS